jgi:uncharacterized membrane protein YsdA (DUF1294 family)
VAALLLLYALASVVAFGMYWVDKRRARRGEWRVPEFTLHVVELLGGWPGAWLAQRTLRHKSSKHGYRVVFIAIVAAHAAGWLWWALSSRS